MGPISSVVNRVKEVARSMGKKISDDEGFIRQGKFTPVRAAIDYFNPASNQGQNFWSTPAANKLGELQQSLEQRTLPMVNLTQYAQGIKEPVPRLGAELGLGVVENILNIPQRLAYGAARVGKDVRTVLEGGEITPRRAIGTAAELALPLTDISTLGGGALVKGLGKQAIKQVAKEGLKSTVKRAVIEGGLLGAGYGALSGAAEGDEAKLGNVLEKSIIGGLLGGSIAGIVGVGGGLLGLIKKSPQVEQELIQRARNQPRNPKTGEWVTTNLKKPKGMTNAQWEFQLEFNKKYDRNPYTPVYASDLKKAIEHELNKKQFGLSIRDINKNVSPFVEEPTEKAVGKIKIKGIPEVKPEAQIKIKAEPTVEGSQIGIPQSSQKTKGKLPKEEPQANIPSQTNAYTNIVSSKVKRGKPPTRDEVGTVSYTHLTLPTTERV